MVQPNGIALDTAAVVSTVLEGILYGFSILMFIGTVWSLMYRRAQNGVINKRMITIACLLLLFSTAHMVIDIIRVWEGLVQQRTTFEGGPIMFFSDVAQWTFVQKNMLYVLQTLVGDGVVIYRCYAVWQSWLVVIFPLLLWTSVGVTGAGCIYSNIQATDNKEDVFAPGTGPWVTAFLAATLLTNIFSTSLLAYRIWKVGKRVTSASQHVTQAVLWPILRVVLDAGVFYSLALLAALLCFVAKNRGQLVLLDMIMPIISLTFYMVIIRITVTQSTSQQQQPASSGATGYLAASPFARTPGGIVSVGALSISGAGERSYPMKRMEVHITQLTETHEHELRDPDQDGDGNEGDGKLGNYVV